MAKYCVQLVDKFSDEVEEDFVDGMVFDSESEAEEYANYMNSCESAGAEILRLNNCFEYEDEYEDCNDSEYVAAEME